ncbi:hypothetical protein JCM11251_005637 [Rhodosporidiobolus azoricus]
MSADETPTVQSLKYQAAQEKSASGTQQKRELAGDDAGYLEPSGVNSAKRGQGLDNPLSGISLDRLEAMGRAFAREKGLEEFELEFAKGAQAAQDPTAIDNLPLLSDEDREVIRREVSHRWSHPTMLFAMVVLCSIAAASQGMDQSVVNGANLFYPVQGVWTRHDEGRPERRGLVAGAPYLCCAVFGCWLTAPCNKYFGRRGAIWLSSLISLLGSVWSALTGSWQHLLVARLFLGIGVGINSATVPVFAAECAPPLIRGALVMQWQTWTAFGIMLGTATALMFFNVDDVPGITGLNWRLILGSAIVPSVVIMAGVYFIPESPRWLIGRGRYVDAFHALCRLRHSRLQAARDLFAINALIEEEQEVNKGKNPVVELFRVPRNRRAAVASGIVMFGQQFCGINVIAYYSSTIFRDAGFDQISALGASLGFGALNWIFAAPAIWTIDLYGRRTLLLISFPLMAVFLLVTGFAFFIPEGTTARIAVVALGIYAHCIAYSPGEGPVPFTYSAECFPMAVRDVGMSYATALLWGFNFIVALTFPRLLDAFTPTGAFGWYAGWNVILAVLVLFFVPETKGLSLEELDGVFSVPTGRHASYQGRAAVHGFRKYILRQNLPDYPPLYAWDNNSATFNKAEMDKFA